MTELTTDDELLGLFTRDEAIGAEKNGTIMEKINTHGNDAHKDGSRCRVIGSILDEDTNTHGYFVVWDDRPKVACFIAGIRLRPVSS